MDESDLYQFSLESLAPNGRDYEPVAEFWAGELDRLEDDWTYDDILDTLDGSPWEVDGKWLKVDLGDSTVSPEYKRLKAIGRQVKREISEG